MCGIQVLKMIAHIDKFISHIVDNPPAPYCFNQPAEGTTVKSQEELVSSLAFRAQSTTRDYIRAEGDFHEETYSSKDQYGRDKTGKIRVRKRKVVGRI